MIVVEELLPELYWVFLHQAKDLSHDPSRRTRPQLLPILRSHSSVEKPIDHCILLRTLLNASEIAHFLTAWSPLEKVPESLFSTRFLSGGPEPIVVSSEIRAICLEMAQHLSVNALNA